ncbi:MAG: MCE family protein [Niastella sp.]|nr:MCE family protein [Niastella sp.]
MTGKTTNHIKLGMFVLAGLLFLIITLYFIGKDRDLFGRTFILKTRFHNVQGLVPGNNVRFAGIDAGTVRKIIMINDTIVEVVMVIQNKMQPFIKKNAITAIGTDGLMGNKVINIESARQEAPHVAEGDILTSRRPLNTDDMLRTLDRTNNDIAVVAENLKTTVWKLNNSTALWALLNDKGIPADMRRSVANIQIATARASAMMANLDQMVAGVKAGKGSLGRIVTDTILATKLDQAVDRINSVGEEAGKLAGQLRAAVTSFQHDLNQGKGTINALLKDSVMAIRLSNSLGNIEQGTNAFNQNMEALKHSFLFRGYFRRLEKQQQKAAGNKMALQ